MCVTSTLVIAQKVAPITGNIYFPYYTSNCYILYGAISYDIFIPCFREVRNHFPISLHIKNFFNSWIYLLQSTPAPLILLLLNLFSTLLRFKVVLSLHMFVAKTTHHISDRTTQSNTTTFHELNVTTSMAWKLAHRCFRDLRVLFYLSRAPDSHEKDKCARDICLKHRWNNIKFLNNLFMVRSLLGYHVWLNYQAACLLR